MAAESACSPSQAVMSGAVNNCGMSRNVPRTNEDIYLGALETLLRQNRCESRERKQNQPCATYKRQVRCAVVGNSRYEVLIGSCRGILLDTPNNDLRDSPRQHVPKLRSYVLVNNRACGLLVPRLAPHPREIAVRQRRAGNAMPSIESTTVVAFSQPTLEGPQPSQYWQGMGVSSPSLR
jgi:hypothetical protein